MKQQKLWVEVGTSKRLIVFGSRHASDAVHDWCCGKRTGAYPETACSEIREALQLPVEECIRWIKYF